MELIPLAIACIGLYFLCKNTCGGRKRLVMPSTYPAKRRQQDRDMRWRVRDDAMEEYFQISRPRDVRDPDSQGDIIFPLIMAGQGSAGTVFINGKSIDFDELRRRYFEPNPDFQARGGGPNVEDEIRKLASNPTQYVQGKTEQDILDMFGFTMGEVEEFTRSNGETCPI